MNAYQKFNHLAEQVTHEIIAQMEQGQVLWQKPWSAYGLPRNYSSGRPYGGFNAFYLNYITEKNSFRTPCFITFKQAQEMGGHVRRGQKGTPIVYWKIYEPEQAGHPTDQEAACHPRDGKKVVPFLWTVFNIDQVEGVDFHLPDLPERSAHQVIAACQQVVDGFPAPCPRILHGGSQAWYGPVSDIVQLPKHERFHSPEAYYATLFHELIHATGHADRLGRFPQKEAMARFGDKAYSREELLAEMGASFLCAHTGIRETVFQNSGAYLQGWISRLRQDPTLIFYTGTRAFKAAGYILDLKAEQDKAALPATRETA